jgi:hypothetical protein
MGISVSDTFPEHIALYEMLVIGSLSLCMSAYCRKQKQKMAAINGGGIYGSVGNAVATYAKS